jgi:hypothetical protein
MTRPQTLSQVKGQRVHRNADSTYAAGGVLVSCPDAGCGATGEVRELRGGGVGGWCVGCGGDVLADPLAVLLAQVEEQLRRFVVFASVDQVVAVVLWVAHSHAIAAADVTAYLTVHSAEKRSGKSRLLDVLELLVRVPWRVVTPTEAVTYRMITRDAPTLLLDEVDAIFSGKGAKEHEGLRALLNAGFQRGTRVPRCVGPKQDLQEFEVYCCKALAGIGSLPDTVADRSIPIRLRRRKAAEKVARFRRREVEPVASTLRDQLTAWASGSVDELRDARPVMPAEISDRAEEAWEPLIAIADMAGGDWPGRARAAAIALGTGTPEDGTESIGVRLLGDVRVVLADLGDPERVTTAQLLEGLHALEEAPWGDWYGKPLGAEKLARTLREFGCRSGNTRVGEKVRKAYDRVALEDAFERYLPGFGPSTRYTRYNPDGYAENNTISTRYSAPDVAGSEKPSRPHGYVDVARVAGSSTEDGDETELERLIEKHGDLAGGAS